MSQTRVVAAVVRRGNLLLVCQRPCHKRHGGLWEFPGGKCELGESDEATLRRELEEELSVTTTTIGSEIISFADAGSAFNIVFIPAEIVGEPLAIEHQALAWATAEQLLQMELAPSDRYFVEFLITTR